MLSALVIGGSLGGLFAANMLHAIGWHVDVFERVTDDLACGDVDILLRVGAARGVDQTAVLEVYFHRGVPNLMKRAMRCHDFGSGLEERPAA